MFAPLARDQHGNPFELPAEAKYWRVRRHTRGRPAEILARDGEPLLIAITGDEPELRAQGCTGAIRLDAVDGERRPLSVQATYVDLGSGEEVTRVASSDGDKEMVRVCFDSMTRTMEGMQRAQVERERTLAQKEQALTESQIASQKMIVELMIAVLDRVGGAKPQDTLSLLKQQFEIQRTLERQVARNAPALADTPPAPEPKGDDVPKWLRFALPGLQELVVGMFAKGDEGKAQFVRNMCGAIMNSAMAGNAPAAPQSVPVATAQPDPQPQPFTEVRRVAPKAMREVLAMLDDEEALTMERMLAVLEQDEYLAVCDELGQLPDLDGRLLLARRLIARVGKQAEAEAPSESTTPATASVGVPGIPSELIPVLAQLSPDDQQLGLQLLSWLDVATTEKLIASLSALPPDVALAKLRGIIDEARRRGPSIAHRAASAALRDDGVS